MKALITILLLFSFAISYGQYVTTITWNNFATRYKADTGKTNKTLRIVRDSVQLQEKTIISQRDSIKNLNNRIQVIEDSVRYLVVDDNIRVKEGDNTDSLLNIFNLAPIQKILDETLFKLNTVEISIDKIKEYLEQLKQPITIPPLIK